jgi:hypothetical protein
MFLKDFANYDWPDSDWVAFDASAAPGSRAARQEWERRYETACKAGAEWFERHRRYGAMFPRECRENSPGDRFFAWQVNLQRAWSGECAETRNEALKQLIALYSATAFANREDLDAYAGVPELARPRLVLDAGNYQAHVRRLASGEPPRRPLKDGFLDALYRAYEIAPKMRRCGNPKCQRPFFIARRRSDRFCSKACGLPSKRQSKLKWWEKHKKEILAQRRAERRKRKSQRKGK